MALTNLQLVQQVDSSPAKIPEAIYLFKSHTGIILGKVLPSVASKLSSFDAFEVDHRAREIRLIELATESERSSHIAGVMSSLREAKAFSVLEGWRDELYPVYAPNKSLYFTIERSSACLLGLVTYGCHITGYIPATMPEDYLIWVPRRSPNKPTWPDKLDNTVAGGLSYPLGPLETCIKECGEEAGLEPTYVERNLKPVGVLTYEFQLCADPEKETAVYQPEVEYIYDLIMDAGVTPVPVDGEVASFELMTVSKVRSELAAGEFKYNCAMVLIDFFVRHGLLTPENEPDYLEILMHSHRQLPYPLR